MIYGAEYGTDGMDNKWKEIWGNKGINYEIQNLKGQDEFTVYSALKRQDGYDVSVQEAENCYKILEQQLSV